MITRDEAAPEFNVEFLPEELLLDPKSLLTLFANSSHAEIKQIILYHFQPGAAGYQFYQSFKGKTLDEYTAYACFALMTDNVTTLDLHKLNVTSFINEVSDSPLKENLRIITTLLKNQHAYPEKNHSLWLSHTYLPTDAYTNLQGINFTNCNLRQVDFTNSLLGNNNFSHAQLNNANFQGMNLRHCAFIHANLHGTQFQACDLSHCLMQHADLTHANLQHATLITSNLTHAIMTNVNARHADFTRAKFTDALCNSADFSDATMVRSVIDNAIFDRASLKSANLEHARFYAASFKYADLTQANLAYSFGTCPDFSRANMDSANLQHADFSYAAKQGRLIHTNLNNADLRHANLDKVEADGISLVNAKLDHTKIHLLIKMEHPQFFDALLLNPDLLDAYLTQLNNMIITMAASEREETRIAIAKSLGSHLAELPEQQSQANLELAWQHALLRDAEHNQLATVANSGLALLRYTASFFYKQPPHQAGDDFMKTPAQEALLRQATRRG